MEQGQRKEPLPGWAAPPLASPHPLQRTGTHRLLNAQEKQLSMLQSLLPNYNQNCRVCTVLNRAAATFQF